jgi:hypothetical protein
MIFAGLPWAWLLGTAAVAGSLVVLFYVLKLRRRAVAVPFVGIWQRVLDDRDSSTWFAHLRRLLSLLLQLVLLALLLLALADPRTPSAAAAGRHRVVLVDTSASMRATDVEPTRSARARAEVERLIQALGRQDRMLVARLEGSLTPLTTMTQDRAQLLGALEQLTPTDTRAELERGLRFALDSLHGLPNPEIVLVGDGAYPDWDAVIARVDLGNVSLSFVPVGSGGNNVAVTEFSARRYPLDKARHEVLIEVSNTGDKPVQVELSLFGDGQLIDVSRLRLGAKERLPRVLDNVSGASRRLEAEVKPVDGSRDELPADDRAYALMPERRRARVLVVSEGNTYLDAALLLDEFLSVTSIRPKDYPPPGDFDVTFFDGVAPAPAPRTGARVYLGVPEEGSPVPRGKPIEMFGFDQWDRKSSFLRWLSLEDVQVAEGFALRPGPQDRVLGASELGPLLVSGRQGADRYLVLGFDPRKSDFVLRVAWPLFVLNAVTSFVEEDTSYLSSFRTGDVWRVPVPSEEGSALVLGPDGVRRTTPVREGHAVLSGDRAGFYRVELAGASPQLFAANLVDLQESNLEVRRDLGIQGRPLAAPEAPPVRFERDLWVYLLAAALALSVLEWFSYHRRVTV